MLKGKNILIGITGGIAAYKIYDLIRLYRNNQANVKVIVTDNALKFVSKLTLQTLSSNIVYNEQFETEFVSPEHISLAGWGDILVIAPATANTISKIANGICDNLLTSITCAFKKHVLIVPAMNTGMWENPFIQDNINKLKQYNFEIVEPEEGFLACGGIGKGRLPDCNKIFMSTQKLLALQFLKGKKVLITAGGTFENIDPVRYIGNYSSGKMGIALADAAFNAGADVTLVSSVDVVQRPYAIIALKSAQQIYEYIMKIFKEHDVIVMAAAIADYRCEKVEQQKIKKTDNNEKIHLTLVKNPDILKALATNKLENQIIVGFCAETENLLENAKKKILNKGCDYIVANDVSNKDIGFNSNENEVVLLDKNLNIYDIPRASKYDVAQKIWSFLYDKQV